MLAIRKRQRTTRSRWPTAEFGGRASVMEAARLVLVRHGGVEVVEPVDRRRCSTARTGSALREMYPDNPLLAELSDD